MNNVVVVFGDIDKCGGLLSRHILQIRRLHDKLHTDVHSSYLELVIVIPVGFGILLLLISLFCINYSIQSFFVFFLTGF